MPIKTLLFTIIYIICLNTASFSTTTQASIKVSYPKNKILLNEEFSIVIHLENEKLTSVSNFPEIEDFVKKNTSFVKNNESFIITQTYVPTIPGAFILNPFQIFINNKKYSIGGSEITVIDKKKKSSVKPDPVSAAGFTSVNADAYFSMESDKEKVFVSEGFKVDVAFFIGENNRAELNFVNLQNQLEEIIRDIRDTKTWIEEISTPKNIKIDTIKIKNNRYVRYLFYSAIIYPLEGGELKIPEQNFKILKYKIRRENPNLIERREDFLALKSKAITIKVSALPDHPLKDKVPVGDFFLEEKITPARIKAGDEFKYTLSINSSLGSSSIPLPIVKENKIFNIFTPKVSSVQKQGKKGEIIYQVIFEYPVVVEKPGIYKLDSIFEWSYFNSKAVKYQTLKPTLTLHIEENENKTELIEDEFESAFYKEMISKASNTFRNKEKEDRIKLISNFAILLMLIFTVILILKK